MTKTIMIQGTASGVGKSIITTGLCRIFQQKGFKVAPFKAQNMSSNAHYLADGSQMARSQAIQAYACGIEPHADMNPVLLKLASGQLEPVFNGISAGPMLSQDYDQLKPTLWPRILEPFNRLATVNDILVLEGAGSPVELNLKQDDLVNMGLASRVNAPVILVGDIDRGGVFAAIYGTLELLSATEKSLVKGVVINKCQGKLPSFAAVKSQMEALTKLPVLGMVPYLSLDIEDEDNLIDPKTGAKTGQGQNSAASESYMASQFDLLAANLSQHLDLERLEQIMGF